MQTDRLLEGKRAFVSAGAAGVGRAIALLFAQQGAAVAITDIDEEAGRRTEAELKALSPGSFFLPADMADRAQIEEACREVLRRFGRVDCLINNAGHFERAYAHQVDLTRYRAMMELNVLCAVRCTTLFLPGMLEARAGTIVNISSDYTRGSVPQVGAYAASKGALNAYGRAVAMDYARWGIRCNNLLLGMNLGCVGRTYQQEMPRFRGGNGYDNTQPLHRPATVEDAAHGALYLASDLSAFMTGEDLPVDGGIQALAHVQDWG